MYKMGGGLFGTPLQLNPKCLAFSGFVLGVYWLPHPKAQAHRVVANVLLAVTAYILMAWQDQLQDCNDSYRLRPTLFGWLSMPFKPERYRKEQEALPIKQQKIVRWFDYAILLIVLAAFVQPFYVK